MLQDIYVLRVWQENSEAWRVTITDTRSQEKFHFANLDVLIMFFKERLEDTRVSTDHPKKS